MQPITTPRGPNPPKQGKFGESGRSRETAEEQRNTDRWAPPTTVALSPTWGPGAYPRLARLPDRSLIGSTTTLQGGMQHLRVSHSGDHGKSFTDIGTIAEGVGDIDNAHLIQLDRRAPQGHAPRLLAAYRNHTKDSSGKYLVFRISISRSDDAGHNWAPHSLVEQSQCPNGLWEPFLHIAPDNSLQVYYARELAPNDQDIVMRTSRDDGRTWGAMQTVSGAGMLGRDGMPGVANFHYPQGGRSVMLMIFESSCNGGMQIMSQNSWDAGKSWSSRSLVYKSSVGSYAGAPQVATVGGRFWAVFMVDDAPQSPSVRVMASTGTDAHGVLTWTPTYTVSPPPAYWPGILGDADAGAWVLYNAVTTYLPSSLFGGGRLHGR